jgi:hypothetical protein
VSVLSLRPKPGQPRSETRRRASIQATTLDLLWISGGVVCFAGPQPDAQLYRAILAVAGPPQTPRGLAESGAGALAGYRAMLSGLDHPVQILVHPEPFDAAAEAARWDARAAALPPPLAELAREHAAWVRRELASARLLVRRAYLVVPAEGAATDARPDWRARARLGSRPAPTLGGGEEARAVLAERCEQLSGALAGAGVAARRLDDLALARLYRDCWGTRGSAGDRLDRDLAALLGRSA